VEKFEEEGERERRYNNRIVVIVPREKITKATNALG